MAKGDKVPAEVMNSLGPLIEYVDKQFWERNQDFKGRKLDGTKDSAKLEKIWTDILIETTLDSVRGITNEGQRLRESIAIGA